MIRNLLMLMSALALCLGSVLAFQGEKIKQAAATEKETGVAKPEIIEKVNPKYPEEAKKEKVTGKVIVEATIGTDGKVLDARVVNEADSRLAQAALDAVRQWKFKPAQKNGKPVKVKSTVTLNFQLK